MVAARQRKVPVVADRANATVPEHLWVDFDHDTAIITMCYHLFARSGRRDEAPVLLTSDGDDSYTAGCQQAYELWCGRRGVVPEVIRGTRDAAGTSAIVRERLRHDPPGAIVGLEDDHAGILTEEAEHAGLRPPEDIALGCFTESVGGPDHQRAVTHLTVSPEAMGSRGIELLIDTIEGRPPRRDLQLVPSVLLA